MKCSCYDLRDPEPTPSERLMGLKDARLVKAYDDWISDKTPDRYGYPVPHLKEWREAKLREFQSLLFRLSDIGEQMKGSGRWNT